MTIEEKLYYINKCCERFDGCNGCPLDGGRYSCLERTNDTIIEQNYNVMKEHMENYQSGFLHASEIDMMFEDNEEVVYMDRANFVRNLGVLLSQTRNSIESCSLDKDDIVTITFKNGSHKYVNVSCDSYAAIIRDVTKNI